MYSLNESCRMLHPSIRVAYAARWALCIFALAVLGLPAGAQRVVHESAAQWENAPRIALTVERQWCTDIDAPGCDFKGPATVHALPDGGLLAGDAQGPLNRFSASGQFIGALGRRGKGPGEYGFVFDADVRSNGLVSWFDMTAMRIASVSLDNKPGPTTTLIPPYTIASYFMVDTTFVVLDVPASRTVGEMVDATYHTVPATGAPRVLARVRTPSVLTPGSDLRPMSGPFDPRVMSDVSADGDIAHSNGAQYDVLVFPKSGDPWRLTIDVPSRAVTAAERDSAQASLLKRFRVSSLAALPPPVRDAYAKTPSTHPPITLMKVLRDGTLWVRTAAGVTATEASAAARWDVFARSGKRIGQARLPFGARVWDGTRDWVIVSELGNDDVPRLVRYRVSPTPVKR